MTAIAERSLEILRAKGVPLERGLSAGELDEVESRIGARFGADHRALLGMALPSGPQFPDWRNVDESLREWIAAPTGGVLFDVEHGNFWIAPWGEKPADDIERDHLALTFLQGVPVMLPLFAHRCMAADSPAGAPVFSIHQTDVIFYGRDMADYWSNELEGWSRSLPPEVWIDFWSDLATPTPGFDRWEM